MPTWLIGIKTKLFALGAAIIAALIVVAKIFFTGKRAGEAEVKAQAQEEQLKTVETAKQVHEQATSESDRQVADDLAKKYSRSD